MSLNETEGRNAADTVTESDLALDTIRTYMGMPDWVTDETDEATKEIARREQEVKEALDELDQFELICDLYNEQTTDAGTNAIFQMTALLFGESLANTMLDAAAIRATM
jgi:L-fucose isomerase-like protein